MRAPSLRRKEGRVIFAMHTQHTVTHTQREEKVRKVNEELSIHSSVLRTHPRAYSLGHKRIFMLQNALGLCQEVAGRA